MAAINILVTYLRTPNRSLVQKGHPGCCNEIGGGGIDWNNCIPLVEEELIKQQIMNFQLLFATVRIVVCALQPDGISYVGLYLTINFGESFSK